MPDYTRSEVKCINDAWSELKHWADQHSSLAYELEDAAKEERRASRSPSFSVWSITECRLYVLRQAFKAINGCDNVIKPSSLHIRVPLAMTYIRVSSAVAHDMRRDTTDRLQQIEALCGKLRAAVAAHEVALRRYLDASKARLDAMSLAQGEQP